MKHPHSTRRSRRKVLAHPDLFAYAAEVELLSARSIRTIVRRSRVSPAVAGLIADLCGLVRE